MATSLNRLSRRDLLVGGCAAAASLAGVTNLLAQTNSRARVLALIGDRYHNPDYIRVALTRMFDGLRVSVDYTMLYDQLSRNLLKDYQVFLCLRDGMIWPGGYLGPDAYTAYSAGLENRSDFPEPKPQTWLTEEMAVAVKDFVSEGKGSTLSTTTAMYRCPRRRTATYRAELTSVIRRCARSKCV